MELNKKAAYLQGLVDGLGVDESTKEGKIIKAMAALLGPISKRQFGQNERSTFGFLSSVEPHGFRSYLNSTLHEDASWYRPSDYWDYLRSNLEPAILASPDGHRWSQAAEAVERAEAKTGDALLVELIKNIAVIDMFRNGSGLAADAAVIGALFHDKTREQLDEALAAPRQGVIQHTVGSGKTGAMVGVIRAALQGSDEVAGVPAQAAPMMAPVPPWVTTTSQASI